MKKTLVVTFVGVLCLTIACNKKNETGTNSMIAPVLPNSKVYTITGAWDSQPIPIDSANKMIHSYLISINYNQTDTNLRSLIFNADSLRNYLNDTIHGKITYVKFIFAHTLDYINSGGYGLNAGFSNHALTMIIAGYDKNNNYIYNPQQMVYDHMIPCPTQCPSSGTASGDLLP